jgi:DNA replication protein DnaC
MPSFDFLVKLSNIPEHTIVTHRLSNFLPRNEPCHRALEAAKLYLTPQRGHHFLTFASKTTGSGKTHLAWAIGWEYLMGCSSVFYGTVPDMLVYLREGIRNEYYNVEARIHYLQEVKLLILDDLGTEHRTDFANESLDMVVNSRYTHLRSTVITTNLNSDELQPRISSRAKEGVTVYLDTTDYREIIAQQRQVVGQSNA